MHRLNWDDLQFVLAVVEAGTVAGAARQLGVNHATVLRRIAAFEDRVGTAVFERSAQGYRVRPDRLRLIEAAREAGRAIDSVERLAQGLDAALSGPLRITSTDTLCQFLLPSVLADLRGRAAGLQLSLICTNLHLNLSRLEAELTVRPAQDLPAGLVGDAGAIMDFAIYAADGAQEAGWLGLGGPLDRSRPAAWVARQIGPSGPVATADSFMVLRELAARGIGKAMLPCLIADRDPRLARVEIDLPEDFSVPIWVACHEDLASVPRVIQIRELLREAISHQWARMSANQGRSAPA